MILVENQSEIERKPSIADIKITSKQNLSMFFDNIQVKKLPYVCKECFADFADQEEIRKHVFSVHERKIQGNIY